MNDFFNTNNDMDTVIEWGSWVLFADLTAGTPIREYKQGETFMQKLMMNWIKTRCVGVCVVF